MHTYMSGRRAFSTCPYHNTCKEQLQFACQAEGHFPHVPITIHAKNSCSLHVRQKGIFHMSLSQYMQRTAAVCMSGRRAFSTCPYHNTCKEQLQFACHLFCTLPATAPSSSPQAHITIEASSNILPTSLKQVQYCLECSNTRGMVTYHQLHWLIPTAITSSICTATDVTADQHIFTIHTATNILPYQHTDLINMHSHWHHSWPTHWPHQYA